MSIGSVPFIRSDDETPGLTKWFGEFSAQSVGGIEKTAKRGDFSPFVNP
jgi:hypothetical protein